MADKIEMIPIRRNAKYGHDTTYNTVLVHPPEVIMAEGEFLMRIVEKHAMVAAEPDGEDSAGRQRLKLANASELVERAAEVSALTFAAMRERGWAVATPTLDELEDRLKEAENKKEKN